jgi:hypothetical protein
MSDKVYFSKKELSTAVLERIFPILAAACFGYDLHWLATGGNPMILLPLMFFMAFGTGVGIFHAIKPLIKSTQEKTKENKNNPDS